MSSFVFSIEHAVGRIGRVSMGFIASAKIASGRDVFCSV